MDRKCPFLETWRTILNTELANFFPAPILITWPRPGGVEFPLRGVFAHWWQDKNRMLDNSWPWTCNLSKNRQTAMQWHLRPESRKKVKWMREEEWLDQWRSVWVYFSWLWLITGKDTANPLTGKLFSESGNLSPVHCCWATHSQLHPMICRVRKVRLKIFQSRPVDSFKPGGGVAFG